ncbi:dihydrofolate reductase [Flavobacteriaceae bacterium]|jgi:dihydrofolate reductase|nr:dihydrofolate reductase [Flavobacteriaceae bacterium]MDB0069012.1 dihydrofolate reductase [Flavobacteriaceae bacterium]MDB9793291.1 dihydrofolate reductase [Flavobacteriaceae bacterium]MDB9849034.1 dihydrofolate reductase [Flavobacteriaceae bacterium]MDB9852992.1 dihydrofolate reductase [Flavobacteriaceae bacterium]|tara:strand:+ start:5960 stop:6862 length:903 start_codon:yes stop_codon:yes gene_type:complete
MLFKNNDSSDINEDQIALIEYAQNRIKSKKRLFFHFSIMIIGFISMLTSNLIFEFKKDIILFDFPWSYWLCSTWFFLFFIHLFNVYVTNKFMGKKWEKNQMKKLVNKQQIKIAEIKTELEKEARIIAESQLFSQNSSKNTVTLIAAASENNIIGKDNKLIWRLSDDLKHFKELTKGHFVIMGRKTFESMPKALPNRTNVIITRKTDYKAENAIVVNSLEKALKVAENDNQPFIIGGGEIYKLSIEIADRIELTRVHTSIEGDTSFPEINLEKWQEVKNEKRLKDEKNEYDFSFLRYDKIN